jgi:hypothetical protein
VSSLDKTRQVEIFCWLGEDELGSGDVGLKQGIVPAGCIPLVAVKRSKMEPLLPQSEAQARKYGKRIRLCRFTFAEVVAETESGE